MTGLTNMTDPVEFERFHTNLTNDNPGYVPWYFLLSRGLKDPAKGISWKQLEGRLTFGDAKKAMRAGNNIGIAATAMDPLCIVDVDDITITPDTIVKPTLSTTSRKRIGHHYFYLTSDPRCKTNLPTGDKGEIRANFQYVVAPGSFVLCSEKEIAAMPESERAKAGRYTVLNDRSPDTIVFNELPPVFLEQAKKNRAATKKASADAKAKVKARKETQHANTDDRNRSAMWSITLDDIMSIPDKTRFKSIFHESSTGKNTAVNSNGGLTCWRHLVTHTPLSALAVMAGVTDCLDAGQGINSGTPSGVDYRDGATVAKMWCYAKHSGIIPKDDPIPGSAIRWYAIDAGLCAEKDLIDGWKLPGSVYQQTLALIEEKNGVSVGRRIMSSHVAAESHLNDSMDTPTEVCADMFLVGDKKTFDINGFAKWIVLDSGMSFATLSDTDEVLQYDHGVYMYGGNVTIKKRIEQIMDGTKITTHVVNEVVGHVQRRTYIDRDEFDCDESLINLKNGIYDTRTKQLSPHTPSHFSMVQVPVSYDPDARCPVIDQFLNDVMDPDDVETVVEWFGYLLEPSHWIQKMLMLIGEGSNGKSKFLGLLSVFIGKTNISNESIQNLSSNRFRVANLHGKLANIHADIGSKALSDTGILKLLSGGDDVSAEKKNKPSFEFANFARLVFSANRLPHAADDTDAWYRRWTFINFTRKFGDDPDAVKKADKNLLAKLTTDMELSGMLNRALAALQKLHAQDGFSNNLSTEATRKIYMRLSDPVATFIEDRCVEDPSLAVRRSQLFSEYVLYCHDDRQVPIGQAMFTRRIRDMGKFGDCQVGGQSGSERGWRGLAMNEDALLWSDASADDEHGDAVGKLQGVVSSTKQTSVADPARDEPSDGAQIMRLIGEYDTKYGIHSDRVFSVVAAQIEDRGFSCDVVDDCVLRYRQGHRIYIPKD